MREIFSEPEIRELIAREEGQFLEFKSLWNRDDGDVRLVSRRSVRDWIAEYVAGFANSDGGLLVLGVEDDGTVSGHGYPEEAMGEFLLVPERRLRPALRVRHQRLQVDGKEILVLQVPNSPDAVMVEGNGFPYRVGDRLVREPQEVINERKQAYRRVGFEQRFHPHAGLPDLDLELAQSFFAQTIYARRPVELALSTFGLVVESAGDFRVTNAALLLLGKRPMTRWHRHSGVRFFRVDGEARRHGAHRNVTQLSRLELPIAALVPEAYRFARTQIRRSERLHNLFFREMAEYPEFAWQEALVNAIAHRDYSDESREIEVWFYDDRLVIESPGDLVPPVTIEALRARRPVHASRNPLIARALVEAGIMREEGEGIPRIFEEMEQSLLKLPELEVEANSFRVVLRNEPVFVGPSKEWIDLIENLPLKVGQRRILLARPEGFTNQDYRELNKVDRDRAYRDMHEMVELGVLLPPAAAGRGAVYRLSAEVGELRLRRGDRKNQLRTLLARKGFIQNSDYRNAFEVSRARAMRELRTLVRDGVLSRTGTRRGARYSAGPALTQGGTTMGESS